MLLRALSFIFCLVLLNEALAAEIIFEPLDGQDKKGFISIDGDITIQDSAKFLNIVNNATKAKFNIPFVLLNSDGGNVVGALEISDTIQKYNLNTVVGPKFHCGSACFLIFMSGKGRFAEPSAIMFVHRISLDNKDTLEAKGFSVSMNDIYRSLDVPDNIRMAMLDTPPEQAYFLDTHDLYNISTIHEEDLNTSSYNNAKNSSNQSNQKSSNSSGNNSNSGNDVDIRSGIFASDAYYSLLKKYDTSGLNFYQALDKLSRIAKYDNTGVPEYLIGKMYQDGLSGKKENGKAWNWYEAAAIKKNGLAIFRMGIYYHTNNKDYEALQYISEAAKMGVPAAINYYGYMYESGILVNRDYKIAKEFYEYGNQLLSEQSPYALGNLYLNGLGVVRDRRKACEYFDLAVSRGNFKAYRVFNEVCR